MKAVTLIAVAALAGPLMLAPAAYAAPSQTAAFEQPSQMIQTVANQMLQALNGHRAELRGHPEKIAAIVNKYLVPHFDAQLAADLVLGRYGRTATAAQKARFIEAFTDSMVKNYGAALLEFHSNMLTVYPTHLKPGTKVATVRTVFKRSNGATIPVLFYVYMTPSGWQAFDLNVEGISYVTSYRAELGPQIQQHGLDAVIERLQAGEKPAALKKQP
jgi:phospholipid transport system substrate-binding protein